jgi:ketosteroid isomerase-like protein
VGQFYAEDGFYLPQGSSGYEGPEKIRARWAGEFSGGKFDLEREPKKIEVADAGDMAYEVGTYKVSWDKPREHRKGQGAGNYVTVWKKGNGEWKTAAYIWNRGEQP